MKDHKVTVTQTDPDGTVREFDLNVISHTQDGALCMVYGWYDKNTHYLRETEGKKPLELVDFVWNGSAKVKRG